MIDLLFKDKLERGLDWLYWKFRNPYRLDMPGGNCPVQIEGYLSTGEFYYFRARGAGWRLEIAPDERAWFSGLITFSYGSRDYLPWPDAGWITKREALKLANRAVKKYYQSL